MDGPFDEKPRALDADYLDRIGTAAWLKARAKTAFAAWPWLLVSILHDPAFLAGALLIGVALALRLLPRDYLLRRGTHEAHFAALTWGLAALALFAGALLFWFAPWRWILAVVLVGVAALVLCAFKREVTCKLNLEHDHRQFLLVADKGVHHEELLADGRSIHAWTEYPPRPQPVRPRVWGIF